MFIGPKSPGLIILEHELTDETVSGFIDTYPTLLSNNWQTQSTIRLFSGPYQNAQDDTDAVSSMDFFISRSPAAAVAATSVNNEVAARPTSSTAMSPTVVQSQGLGASGSPRKNSASLLSAHSATFLFTLLFSSILSWTWFLLGFLSLVFYLWYFTGHWW